MNTRSIILLALIVFSITACNQKMHFQSLSENALKTIQAPSNGEGEMHKVEDTVAVSKTTDILRQDSYNTNKISVNFQLLDKDGQTISGLTKDQIAVVENASGVKNFELYSHSDEYLKKVDIVIAIDITGSMQDIINTVKQKVTGFVNQLNTRNVQANLCLVTFKDLVEKRCTKFVEDDPKTTVNENLTAFLDEMSKLHAEGGGEAPENSLGAIESAAKDTPWHADAQRMIVLISDTRMFWFSPANKGEAGNAAPFYDKTLDLLKAKQVNVFPVTPSTHGYDYNFFKYPSIPSVTNGKFFNIDDIVKGKTSFDRVFDYIARRFVTTYVAEYMVEDNELDPTLPLKKRDVRVALKNALPGATMKLHSVLSSMPEGRPEYKKKWALTPKAIRVGTISVEVNGKPVTTKYKVENGEIEFEKYPAPGAEIRVSYEFENLRDNVRLHSISLGKDRPFDIAVVLNDKVATKDVHFGLSTTTEGEYLIDLKDVVFDDKDSYEVRKNNGLKITVIFKTFHE